MRGSRAVIHLAARAHVIHETCVDPLAEFRRANVDHAVFIAKMAARAKVGRFVFVSSIGVLGNSSGTKAFRESDTPSPIEPYAISKWEAEQELGAWSVGSGLPIVIVRPPLVYGPCVKGNFLRLLRLVAGRLPLPFGDVNNRRSYVGVANLCDFLLTSATHPAADGKTFHVADDEDVSTAELLRIMAKAMRKSRRVLRCPAWVLQAGAVLLRRQAEMERLTTNLRVDSTLSRSTLGWQPKNRLPAGIAEMVHWFRLAHNR
jgi:nucleoside-diphosphate-sugar epimerase